jgi:hypothetical protein
MDEQSSELHPEQVISQGIQTPWPNKVQQEVLEKTD